MEAINFNAYQEAWETYFAGWLEAKGITNPVTELGIGWMGYGGENQLKEAFRVWYEKRELSRSRVN